MSLLTVGCASNNFSARVDNPGSQTNALAEVVATNPSNTNPLRDRIAQQKFVNYLVSFKENIAIPLIHIPI
ncbi:MAG TPA: hypothetical protein V6C65_20995, partial [Allocoleopsis sp.]